MTLTAHSAGGCHLAVLTPDVGLASETFIRRHCNELLPGRTAVVARTQEPAWHPQGPVLLTSGLRPPRPGRLQRVRRRLGLGTPERTKEQFIEASTRTFLHEQEVRVLLAEYLHWATSYLGLSSETGLPLWAHAHGMDVSALLRQEQWRIAYRGLADAAGVITMSDASRRRLIEVGLPAHKIHVVPYGVDVPESLPRGERGNGLEEIRCLAVGRMVAKKGPILLLDAFRRAAEQDSRLRLDYVGSGELLAAAGQFLRAFGLEAKVTLHGTLDHGRVRELLARADLFLQHSIVDADTGDEEGLPVAILEAMAAALPVVATRHAGIPEAVLDGETGLLVAEGDTPGMAGAILSLAREPSLRRDLGNAAWQRARERYSWPRERRDLIELLGLPERGTATAASSGALSGAKRAQ